MDAFVALFGRIVEQLGLLWLVVGPAGTVLALVLLLRWGVRWLRRLVFALIATLVVGVWLLNGPLYEHALGFILDRVGDGAGAELEFEAAEGNLLTGRVDLSGISARRLDHDTSVFEVTAERAQVDVSIFSLVFGTPRFQMLRIEGLDGMYRRVGGAPQLDEGAEPVMGGEGDHEGESDFKIDHLEVVDSRIQVTDATQGAAIPVDLAIERLEVDDVRGETALFDVLFRSQASGSIEGHRYQLAAEAGPDRHTSTWRINAMPTYLFSALVGRSIGDLVEGVVQLELVSQWADETDEGPLDITGRLAIVAPEVSLPWGRQVDPAAAVADWLDSQVGVQLRVSLSLPRSRFRGAPLLRPTGLWRDLGAAVSEALSSRLPTGDDLRDAFDGLLDALPGR